MGWKSTIDITRIEAIDAINQALRDMSYEQMTNEELEQVMYSLNIGDNTELPYYGRNFNVVDE